MKCINGLGCTLSRPARRGLGGGAVVLALLGALFLAACASPIGVEYESPRQVRRDLTANVLSTGQPSTFSVWVLQRLGLAEIFGSSPQSALAALHAGLAGTGDSDRLFALAELSFLQATRGGGRPYYFASAVYAWSFLFPGTAEGPADWADPRIRLACDLYNRSIAEGFTAADGRTVVLRSGVYDLPFGKLDISVPQGDFTWAGYRLEHFVSAAELGVRGLRNRYRRAGIGGPLVAGLSPEVEDGAPPLGSDHIPRGLKVPVTAVLRLGDARSALASGQLQGQLQLYTPDDAQTVEVDGARVPLEFETTSALAYTLEDSPIWKSERAGFFRGEFRLTVSSPVRDNLVFLHPYRPGRIPLVLVHGTASSMARWAELVNELENDPQIQAHYQIWLFGYNTGNPIGYSGGLLRQALTNAVKDVDRKGRDPALHDMVVIGHSQGGLLTKLTVIDSGDRFWKQVSRVPLDQLDTDAETRALLRRSLFFTPLPFVKRVVFVATPHGGSYLASFSLSALLSDMVSLPGNVTRRLVDLATMNRGAFLLDDLEHPATSIDNMRPGNRFLQTLREIPVASDVAVNSIVAVRGHGPLSQASDGVVRYESAHVPGVESEKIVYSSHSTQSNPTTIEEIRRILRKHAGLQ